MHAKSACQLGKHGLESCAILLHFQTKGKEIRISTRLMSQEIDLETLSGALLEIS